MLAAAKAFVGLREVEICRKKVHNRQTGRYGRRPRCKQEM
jgi:hypothetical protein